VTAVALVLQYLGSGVAFARPRLPLNGRAIAAVGLLVAGATGVGAWLFGLPFLTSAHGYVHLPLIGELHLATAIAFDLGVYLTVVGGVMLILTLLGSGEQPLTPALSPDAGERGLEGGR
jgi:multicomponent K+:H+ antiporter subunit A